MDAGGGGVSRRAFLSALGMFPAAIRLGGGDGGTITVDVGRAVFTSCFTWESLGIPSAEDSRTMRALESLAVGERVELVESCSPMSYPGSVYPVCTLRDAGGHEFDSHLEEDGLDIGTLRSLESRGRVRGTVTAVETQYVDNWPTEIGIVKVFLDVEVSLEDS